MLTLFVREAKDETIAATSAAKVSPKIPLGNSESIEGYALLLSPSNDGIVVPSKATAIKPGRTTTTGISILRKPANIKPFCASLRLLAPKAL